MESKVVQKKDEMPLKRLRVYFILQLNFKKSFKSSAKEQKAFKKFLANCDSIEKHNEKFERKEASFKLRTNSRGDLELEEKQAYMNGLSLTTAESKKLIAMGKKFKDKSSVGFDSPFPEAPDSLDYRELGYVTEVVDQGKAIINYTSINRDGHCENSFKIYSCENSIDFLKNVKHFKRA